MKTLQLKFAIYWCEIAGKTRNALKESKNCAKLEWALPHRCGRGRPI
jgi:hypothetical protein